MEWKIDQILKEMTLQEKAGLCSGENFWFTKAIERLGIPGIMVTDGPHGLRKQAEQADHLGLNASIKAVCFPAGCALASSFDRGLVQSVGEKLGEEAWSENVHTLLGPAINIKRSPLCGRNFEYLSEDPYLAGELAASYINGVQSKGVGVSVKHFACNNQERRRMSVNAKVSQRALREIYLAAFETAVKKAHPWTMMCSYNRINGVYSCENEWLLDKVLRKEWGFDGVVMTDWGAMNDRCKALKAGLELEMPSSHGERDRKIMEAVENGELSMETLDRAVKRLLLWIKKGMGDSERVPYSKEEHHRFAREAAGECAVLLKNENSVLPLASGERIAFIGGFARAPRYQGGGSSHINSFQVTDALRAAGDEVEIVYAEGFPTEGDPYDEQLAQEAVRAAKDCSVAVIFAGLPESFESEGFDRTHLNLPSCQNRLIEEIVAVQPNTVVVLHNGSPVEMPWADRVAAILELYLAGEAAGEAAVDLLFGRKNPCGKLAETFPLRLQDTPCYLDFPGTDEETVYSEDIYVGYRYYDARERAVLFPFGYGLSYTSFALSHPVLSADRIHSGETVEVSVSIKNTGSRAGKEVVQLYVAPPRSRAAFRPVKELKGFEKVELQPGESKTVVFQLDLRSFAYYEPHVSDWYAPGGEYRILLGTSSVDLPLCETVELLSDPLPVEFTDHTTMGDLMGNGQYDEILKPLLEKSGFVSMEKDGLDAGTAGMMDAMLDGMPLHSLVCFGDVSLREIEEITEKLKEKGRMLASDSHKNQTAGK